MANIVVVLLAALVVLVLLYPVSGIDTIPPQCFSTFGYTVPCGDGLSLAAGAAAAGVVAVTLWLKSRRR